LGDDSETVGGVSRVIETGMWNLLVVKTFRTSRRWYAPLA
jgi:ribosomal 30S subunit maturation factor RimM